MQIRRRRTVHRENGLEMESPIFEIPCQEIIVKIFSHEIWAISTVLTKYESNCFAFPLRGLQLATHYMRLLCFELIAFIQTSTWSPKMRMYIVRKSVINSGHHKYFPNPCIENVHSCRLDSKKFQNSHFQAEIIIFE